MDANTIARYANVLAGGNPMPPVRAALVNGALVVVDGWHRLAARERCGLMQVDAEVIEATASEAQWMAAFANISHGLPLKRVEMRTALKALITARKHIPRAGVLLSYRDITAMLGGMVQHTTVRNWMLKDHPKIARQMGQQEEPITGPRGALRDDEAGFYNTVTAALATAAANARGVRGPSRRGAMIEAAERLLRDLQGGGEWSLEEF